MRWFLIVLGCALGAPIGGLAVDVAPVSHPLKAKTLERAAIIAGSQFVVGTDHPSNGTQWLNVIDLPTGEPRSTLQEQLGRDEYAFWTPATEKNQVLVRFKNGGPITVWDLGARKTVRTIDLPDELQGRWFDASMTMSGNGRFLLLRRGPHYHIHDVEKQSWSLSWTRPEKWPKNSSPAVSPADGSLLLAGPKNQLILHGIDGNQTTLTGHEEPVIQGVFLDDGQTAASIGADQTVRVWDLSRKEQSQLIPTEGNPTDLTVSPDGAQLLVVLPTEGATAWDPKNGRKLHRFPSIPGGGERRMSFSPDGEWVLDFGTSTQQCWQPVPSRTAVVVAGEPIKEPKPTGQKLQTAMLRSGFMSADGTFALGLTTPKIVTAFEPVTGKVLQELPTELRLRGSLFGGYVPHPKRNQVFYRDNQESEVVLWDLERKKVVVRYSLPPETRGPWQAIYISPNGRYLSATLLDRTRTLVLDLERGQWEPIREHRIDGRIRPLSPPRPSPIDGSLLVSDLDEKVRLLAPNGSVREFVGSSAKVTVAEFLADGKRFVTGDASGTVRIWELSGGRNVRSIDVGGSVVMISVSANASSPILVSAGGRVRGYDPDTGELAYTLVGEAGNARGKLSGDGSRAITYGTGEPRVWALPGAERKKPLGGTPFDRPGVTNQLKQLKTFAGRPGKPVAVDLSPDAKLIVVALDKGANKSEVYLMDAQTGEPLAEPHFEYNSSTNLHMVKFHPSQRALLLPHPEKAGVRIWSLDEKKAYDFPLPVATARQRSTSVSSADISPDGKYLLLGGGYVQSFLIEIKTGKVVRMISGSTYGTRQVAFTPDGTHMALSTGWLFETEPDVAIHAIGWMSALLPDGKRYVSVDPTQGGIEVRNPEGPTVRFTDELARRHRGGSLDVTPDGRIVVGKEYTLWVGDTSTGEVLNATQFPFRHEHSIQTVTVAAQGHLILVGTYSGAVQLWQLGPDPSTTKTP